MASLRAGFMLVTPANQLYPHAPEVTDDNDSPDVQ